MRTRARWRDRAKMKENPRMFAAAPVAASVLVVAIGFGAACADPEDRLYLHEPGKLIYLGTAPPVEQELVHDGGIRVDTLRGTTVLDSTRVEHPQRLALARGRLFVVERYPPPVLRVVSVGTWTEELALGRTGDGPAEFRSAWRILVSPAGDPWVFDFHLRRLTRLARVTDGPRLIADTLIVRLGFDEPVDDLAWLSDSTLIVQGWFDRSRFRLVSASGKVLATIGGEPPGHPMVSVLGRNRAYPGHFASHPGGAMFVFADLKASRVTIFAADGSVLAAAKAPFDFESGYVYFPHSHFVGNVSDFRYAYVDVAATRDRFFALFSGRPFSGSHGMAGLGLYVHEFDWTGGFHRALLLEHPASRIAVDEDGATLYAIHELPSPEVRAYPIR